MLFGYTREEIRKRLKDYMEWAKKHPKEFLEQTDPNKPHTSKKPSSSPFDSSQ